MEKDKKTITRKEALYEILRMVIERLDRDSISDLRQFIKTADEIAYAILAESDNPTEDYSFEDFMNDITSYIDYLYTTDKMIAKWKKIYNREA
jgi:uncharacterized protein YjcR